MKPSLDLAKKTGVEEDLPIRRTVERPHRRLRHAATAAIGGVAKQHDLRSGVGLPGGLKNLGPAIVDFAQNAGDHASHLVGWRAAFDVPRPSIGLVGRRLAAASSEDFRAPDQKAGVDAKSV